MALGLSEEYVAMVRKLEEMYVAVEHHDARVTTKAAASYRRAARTLAMALAPGYVPSLDEDKIHKEGEQGNRHYPYH